MARLPRHHRRQLRARRLDAGAHFEAAHFLQTQPRDQVGKGLVLHQHRHAGERRRLLLPARNRRAQARGEGLPAGLIGGGIGRIDLGQPLRQRLADLEQIARIGLDVRIAGRMHVALGAVEQRRRLAHDDVARRLEVAGLARLHAGVARFAQDQRQPADLEFGAGGDDQIGVARTRDQRGPGVDAVRVLQAAGRGMDVDALAADLPGQRRPLGNRREHLQRRLRRQGQRGKQGKQEQGNQSFHGRCSVVQNLCAPCAPRLMMYCSHS